MDNELVEYVKKYTARGYSISQIKQTLIKGGHSPREVDEIISHVKAEQVPPKPVQPAPLKNDRKPAPLSHPGSQEVPFPKTPQLSSSTTPPKPLGKKRHYAPFGIRLASYLIDGVFFAVLVQGIGLAFIFSLSFVLDTLTVRILFFVIPLILAFFSFFTLTYMEGTYGFTPAKYFLKLRVINEHNQPPGFTAALLRNIIKAVFIPGSLWILFDEKKQGLHDKAAKTFVIAT